MAETHTPAPESHAGEHVGPSFQTYMFVFYGLCILTGLSFLANAALGANHLSAGIIMVVAIFKAALVAGIFMHLKFDWGKLYGIIIPVSVLGVMMLIILSVDIVAIWHKAPNLIFDPAMETPPGNARPG
jgi:cytochrome c oxidase subunit IV